MHRKTPVLDYLFNKDRPEGLQRCYKETPVQLFPVNIAKFLRTAF